MFERIECNLEVLCGQPAIKGTRRSVYSIVEAFAEGENADTLMEGYPYLSREDIEAALRYAAKLSQEGLDIAL